jgi:hypothetical protein
MSSRPIAPLLLVKLCLFLAFGFATTVEAFAPISPAACPTQGKQYLSHDTSSSISMMPGEVGASSIQVSAATLDPTTVLSDILGGLLGSPAILLVPIGAALAVASLIAFFIVSYANPEVEDDEK